MDPVPIDALSLHAGGAAGLAVMAALLAAPAAGGEWVRVRGPRLEVLSAVGPGPAREAAERLERLRGALQQLLPDAGSRERPLTVFLFGERERFARFVPRAHRRPDRVEGFFQTGPDRDYAVLPFAAGRSRPFEAAEHEYVHLALSGAFPAQPVWVSEGLAELLSDAVVDGDEIRLGAERPEYAALLARERPLPLRALLEVGYDSPEYLGGAQGDVLYAGSWALARWAVHWRGLGGLRAFLGAVAEGSPAAVAFAERLGSLAAADAGLLQVPFGPLFRVRASSGAEARWRSDLPSDADVQQRLGDLLLQGGRIARARSRFERALASDPGHGEARASLARLLGRQGLWSEARREMERALETTPEDPDAILGRVRLRVEEALARGEPLAEDTRQRLVADLEEVVRRAPGTEAALLLVRLRPEPYAERIALLKPLFDVRPQDIALAQTLSHLYVKNRDLGAARRVLERAHDAADEPAYRFLFDHLLSRLGGFESRTAEVRGHLVHLACPSDGSLRFTIAATDATILRLEAASTRSFLVDGEGTRGGERQLVCGAQDLPLAVRYRKPGFFDSRGNGQVVWLSLGVESPEEPRP